MPPTPPRRRSRLLVAVTALLVCVAVLIWLATGATPHLRDRVVAALNGRFQSQVGLDSLRVGVFPRPTVSGTGLALRHHGRTDVPPLITLQSFEGAAGLFGLFRTPLSLQSVDLQGLTIHVPPGGMRTAPHSGGQESARAASGDRGYASRVPSLSIDRIAATQARLEIASKDPRKPPRVFDIHDLAMRGFRPDAPAAFQAALTNPVPRGTIETSGEFGPWSAGEPGKTPVRGKYTFRNAHLDTIRGLGGVLSSAGEYTGVLERIVVTGTTDTPDFQLDAARRPVPLTTRFRAVVDGTSGDTYLEDVQGQLADTRIGARGKVVRVSHDRGRLVSLDATIEDGRIEDVLRLASDATTPPLTGSLSLQSTIVIPPGPGKVVDRLQLDGHFALLKARFTSYDVQRRIATLSRRARGQSGEADGSSVVSNMSGRFVLRDGVLRLSQLSFAVPGAVVRLAGTYALRSGAMDFRGDLLLDAELADTTSGVKATIAKIFQPMFRGPKGGTKLPIRVAGTREKPEFGLDVKRALTPGT